MLHLLKYLLVSVMVVISLVNTIAENDNKKAIELKNYFWNECSNDFKVTEIPKKWKDKPAVIIARSFEKYYKKRRVGGLEFFDYKHYRIKMQSKKALEDYAEFSFPESKTFGGYSLKFYAGYKIIKPNGKNIEVSINDAVVTEMKVNRYQLNMLKLAIPNLEIGDIVDFYIAEQKHIPPVDKYYSFDPSINTLVAAYPIMKQKITFAVERKCYLNAKSLNGAPDFVKQKKGDTDVYVLEDGDRENYEDANWMYPYRQLPTVKFKAVYAKGAITYSSLFLGRQGELKSKVTQNEVVEFVNAYLKEYAAAGTFFYKKFRKRFKGRTDKEEMAKEIYYQLRNNYIIAYVESYVQSGKNQNQDYNNYRFVSILKYVYDQFGIKNKVIVGVPSNISNIEDIILENEIICALKVNDDFVVGDFDNYSIFGAHPYLLEGTEVYEFKDKWMVKTNSLPVSKATDNNITKQLNLTIIDLDKDESIAEINNIFSGHHKKLYQNQLLDFYDYKNEEATKYKMVEYSNPSKKNLHRTYTQKKEAYIDEVQQKKMDYLKTLAESNYDLKIKEVKDFVLIEHGRHHSKPEFEFTYKVNFEGLIKKAGNDYLVNIGKLIEQQINLEKEELERDYDIYMPYPRSYNYKIIFNIPAGYKVEGVENLIVNTETNFGGFVSEAKINADKLIVETKKLYTTNFVAKENWDTMKTFLKAAEDFNDKNILLKAIK